jgi:hypothetical protein
VIYVAISWFARWICLCVYFPCLSNLTRLFCRGGLVDSFQVYHGPVRNLSAFNFSNVLRHPSCFYFFSASAIPTAASPDLEDAVMQRDICWLTGETSLCLRQADCVLL